MRAKSSRYDTMTDQGEEKYFEAGKLALALCKKYLGEVRPHCIVDFPSGYGRALRWFRNEWRSAEIFAVETDERALGFVRSHFNAIPLISDANLRVSLPDNVDLIFCGSLLTHFDEWPWDIFFDKCVLSLEVDGCLIFTVHGRTHASLVKDNPKFFGEGIDGKKLYEDYERSGFSYLPYSADYPEYGISLSSPEWIFRKLQKISYGKIIGFEEQGWGQDVIAIRKKPWPYL